MQHCGICSALAEVFRRLMCIGGGENGVGVGGDCYQQLTDNETRRGGISVDRTDNGLYVRMVDPGTPPARTRRLSQSDWLLLETLDTRYQRPLHTGRFLTMHKRRRKRLTTRSLQQDPALLDDIHHGQVQCVLSRVNQWPFNAFTLDNVTGGRSLPVLCVHLFHWYGLLEYFKLDVVRCWKLFSLIEEGYHSTNPYHNSVHATDVTQAMHCFLQERKIREHLTPLEVMASLIAAVTHDLDHPGVNQPFLIATSNHLAALYENTSVLENHHWRSAIGCLLESHVAEQIQDCRPELQRQISSLILATDITRQQEFLTRFKRYLDQDLLDMKRAEDRHFILQIALKCADISNPCRPWDVSKKWSQKVCEEFFRQGDYERQLNLPVTSLCDRTTTSVPKIQSGFFKFVVYPLFEEWHRFLGAGLSDYMMFNLRNNHCKWEAMVQLELAEETKTEISDTEEADDVEEETSELLPSEESTTRRKSLLTIPDLDSCQRVGRRHSVPLSMPSPPAITKTIIRRESLAIGEHRLSRQLLEEEDEELINLGQSSLSLLSTSSGNFNKSSEGSPNEKRPVSAENLLPEPSIASITTVTEASRLSFVLHTGQSPPRHTQLTRQQTFPPLQPYVRQRYMSTTAEMTSCSESDESPQQSTAVTSSHKRALSVRDGNKKDCLDLSGSREKLISKLWEKENVDPSCENQVENGNNNYLRRNSTQGLLTRRRGSAPVGLINREDGAMCPAAMVLRGINDRYTRRGSVPTDVARQSVLRPLTLSLNDNITTSLQRRSSIPQVPGGSGQHHEAQDCNPDSSYFFSSQQQHCQPYPPRRSSDTNGNTKSRNRKKLCRRSSGGPEMFDNEWRHGRNCLPEQYSSTRRGSLPVDVFIATHSEKLRTLSQRRLL